MDYASAVLGTTGGYCPSPSVAPSLMGTPSAGFDDPASSFGGALGPLSPLPSGGGKLDEELSRIDKEIEHLQNALSSATK